MKNKYKQTENVHDKYIQTRRHVLRAGDFSHSYGNIYLRVHTKKNLHWSTMSFFNKKEEKNIHRKKPFKVYDRIKL